LWFHVIQYFSQTFCYPNRLRVKQNQKKIGKGLSVYYKYTLDGYVAQPGADNHQHAPALKELNILIMEKTFHKG
jgi:hypothetical protein